MSDRGQRLRQALTARGVAKLYALAVEIGVDESAISRWKKGGAISTDNMANLCAVLDISLDWFLLGRGNMDQHKEFSPSPAEREVVRRLAAFAPEALANLSEFLDAVRSDRGKT